SLDASAPPAKAAEESSRVIDDQGDEARTDNRITGLVLADNSNLWTLRGSGRLSRMSIALPPPEAKSATAGEIQQLIDDLAANDWARRERASTLLAGKGPQILKQLQSALPKSKDLEQRRRLSDLIDRLSDRPASGALRAFGSVRVGNVQVLARD